LTGNSVPDPGDRVPPEDRMGDDEKYYFGDDEDFSIRYDSTNDRFVIRDEVNDAETYLPKSIDLDLGGLTDIGKGAEVGKDSDQAIASGANRLVTWEHVNFDDKGEFDLANDKFVAAEAGRYLVTATLYWDNPADQDLIQTKIYVNGAEDTRAGKNTSGTADSSTFPPPCVLDLAAGDEVQIYAYSTADQTIRAGDRFTFAQFIRIGNADWS